MALLDRYNLFYAYKRSKISKQIHATAVNCVIVCLLLQQLVLLFFNMLRGSSTLDSSEGHGPLLSARAIFSITMFTIFSGMFVLQVKSTKDWHLGFYSMWTRFEAIPK